MTHPGRPALNPRGELVNNGVTGVLAYLSVMALSRFGGEVGMFASEYAMEVGMVLFALYNTVANALRSTNLGKFLGITSLVALLGLGVGCAGLSSSLDRVSDNGMRVGVEYDGTGAGGYVGVGVAGQGAEGSLRVDPVDFYCWVASFFESYPANDHCRKRAAERELGG